MVLNNYYLVNGFVIFYFKNDFKNNDICINCLFVVLFFLVMDFCYWLYSFLLGLYYYFKVNVNFVYEKKFGNSKIVLIYFFYNNFRSL